MITIIRRSLWLTMICGTVVTLAASPPVIGVAQSRGGFFVNNAAVPGTATILDGSFVRTAKTSSDVSLKGGERFTLASSSAAKVFQDHVVLEAGEAELQHPSGYRLETGSLRIGASDEGALVRVAIDSRNLVKVAAVIGSAEVRNSQGMLVARVFPGTALQLQAVTDKTIHLTGTLQAEGGKFFLVDETSRLKMELRGSDLKNLVGKRIQVTGSAIMGEAPAAGVSQVVSVAQAATISAPAGSGAAAGAAVATGPSTTTIAVIGGVAAATTLGGLAAAGTIGGSSSSVSR